MGIVILALLNGSRSRDTALVYWDRQDEQLDEAVHAPVDAFARATAIKKRARRTRLDAYPSTQAHQRLGAAFVREKRPGRAMRGWVPSEHIPQAMRIVADEMIREKGVEWREAVAALNDMVAEYETRVSVLAAAHRAHSTPEERAAIARELASLFRAAAGG